MCDISSQPLTAQQQKLWDEFLQTNPTDLELQELANKTIASRQNIPLMIMVLDEIQRRGCLVEGSVPPKVESQKGELVRRLVAA